MGRNTVLHRSSGKLRGEVTLSPRVLAAALQVVAGGQPRAAVAKRFGVSVATLNGWLRRYREWLKAGPPASNPPT
jgi:transposase-like protein